MTREEAITQLDLLLEYCESMMTSEYPVWRRDCEALRMLIAALRPVSREQVEKSEWIWRTEDVYICSSCGKKTRVDECMGSPIYNFCPFCMAPMTDEAVEIVMKREEALHHDGKGV